MAKKLLKEDKVWLPSFRWLLKVLVIIYVVSIVGFFITNYLLKPYMRDIPKEVTPWLNNSDKNLSNQK
jgi:polyferredoxin